MIDLQEDLGTVFYGGDFAYAFLRQRAGSADETVSGIPGQNDRSALDGFARAAERSLRLPASADVRSDDVLQAVGAVPPWGAVAGARFTVLDTPERVGDGMEVLAQVGTEVSA